MFNRNNIIFSGFFLLIFLIIFIPWLITTNWDENNYPNPLKNFTACNMAFSSYICDPDSVIFSKTRRNTLASKLDSFKKVTQNLTIDSGSDNSENHISCKRKGVTAAIALAENYQDPSEEGMKKFAKNTLSNWNLDSECKKSFLIFVYYHKDTETDNEYTEYSIALDKNVPFTECGFWKIYHSVLFGDTATNLNIILDKIVEVIKNGQFVDTNCSKNEAWHLVFGPWGTVALVVLNISVFGFICFCCCKSCHSNCSCDSNSDSDPIPLSIRETVHQQPEEQILVTDAIDENLIQKL